MSKIAKEMSVDSGKNLIKTGKNEKINRIYIPKLQYTPLGLIILFRLINDRDLKILITSSGKTTGTGKTTLALILAKWIKKASNELFGYNENWEADEYAFMDVWEYLQKYKTSKRGDILISDELEIMADRRRFMSDQNLKFSQAWSMLRYKNVVTIGTAPGLMDLEKRIPETADIWINVIYQGRANVYYLTVDDFEWTPIFKRLKMYGFKQSILWNPIEKDKDYQYLKQEKENKGVPGIDDQGKQIDETYVKNKLSELKDETANSLIELIKEKELQDKFTQTEIAKISGWSQQKISKDFDF